MKKTFYSVQYINWGMDSPSTMWFDNREKAIEFASHDFRDRHVTHTFRNPKKNYRNRRDYPEPRNVCRVNRTKKGSLTMLTVSDAISKYRISLADGGMLKLLPSGKVDQKEIAWIKAHKQEIINELTRRVDEQAAAAKLASDRHNRFMSIPGVEEILYARRKEAAYREAFNRAMERETRLPERPFSVDHLKGLETQYPDAVFAIKIYNQRNAHNMELADIADNVYAVLTDGNITDARKLYDNLQDAFCNRHMWD